MNTYVIDEKVAQRGLLNAVHARLRDGEGVTRRFFRVGNKYIFNGDFKHWSNSQWGGFEPDDENVISRAGLLWDHRDSVIQRRDTGKAEDYFVNPAHQS